MPRLSFLPPVRPARLLAPVLVAFSTLLIGGASARAATVSYGSAASHVTSTLRPTFFVNEAATGGGDANISQSAPGNYTRSFAGLLDPNQGRTEITLTGFGWATANSPGTNTATSVTVAFTYLGADEAVGGGDDVFIGSASGAYTFGGAAGLYALVFDTPLSATLDVTGVRFLITVTPTNAGGNGTLGFKTAITTAPLTYETTLGPKFTVAGTARPPRVNLAKFQRVTTSSVSGQSLATYVTDGVVGNDNRWQSAGAGPHWARVDFPHPVQIASAQIFSGIDDGAAMSAYTLQYLSGGEWLDIPGAAVTGNTDVENHLVFTAPVTASAFRLFNSADATVHLRELALYPPNGPAGFPLGTDLVLNLAHKRPAVATANTANNFALLATDGRAHRGSMWQTSLVGPNTLEIDLRVATRIGSAHLYSGSFGVAPLADFTLRYWDGSAWLDIPGATVTGNIAAARVVSFSTPVTTSQVRLVFTNAATTSIQELAIFPANSGNTGYALGTGVTGAIAPSAKFTDYHDAYYQLTSSAVSRSVTVVGDQPALGQAGATLEQGQYQMLLNYADGSYRLLNRATGEVLSGARLSTTAGAPLIDAPYSALPDQDWILQSLDGTHFSLINRWSGLALDTESGSTAAGARLVQNPASGAATQRWRITYSTHFPKKGIGGTIFTHTFRPNWAYNWGLATTPVPSDTFYFPMQWGNFNWPASSTAASTWKLYSPWRATGRPVHLLGFNEPDKFDQAGRSLDPTRPTTVEQFDPNRTIAEAVTLWPRLMAMDQPLIAPCPANMTSGWLASFYTQSTALGYRVDYTANHSYPGPGGGSADGLINSLLGGFNTWGRPMWLTEFSFVDWSGTGGWTEEDSYNTLAEFLWRAESLSWLHKYALFVFTEDANNPQPAQPWSTPTPAPRSNSLDASGNLTAFGQLYAAWDNVASVVPGKTYFVHNRGTRKRLANPEGQATPHARSIRVTGDLVNWTLVNAPTTGRYYVVSSLDGRRLSSDGTTASLVAGTTTGAAVEWTLTEREHGWFFLNHPSSSRRLQLAYNNSTGAATYTMVVTTTTTDATQWRFIVPLATPTWSGANGGAWTDSANWASNQSPTSLTSVIFDSSSTNLATTLGADFEVVGLIQNATSAPVFIGGTHTLTVGTGGLNLSAATENLTLTAPLVLAANQTWNVAADRTLTLTGSVSGLGALTLAGAGKTFLSGAATHAGATTVSAGATLQLGASDILPNGAGAGNFVLNGTLDLNGFSETLNGLSGSGLLDNTTTGTATLTVGGNDATTTFNGVLQNTGGALTLAKVGSGALNLVGANTHTGGLINHGTGNVSPQNPSAFGPGPIVMNAGTLYATAANYTFANDLALNSATLRVGGGNSRTLAWTGPVSVSGVSSLSADGGTAGITLSGGLDLGAGDATLSAFANGNTITVSAPITGTNGTVQVMLGTLQLNSANSFAGTFRAVGGVLRLGHAQALQNATLDLAAADAGSVNLNNLSAVIGALSGSRNLALGGGAVSIGENHLSTTFSGVLGGAGSLTKIGSGTLTLAGVNTYSGPTFVTGGTLALGISNALPSSALSLGDATLDAATFTDTLGTLDVAGAARIRLGAGAALAFANSAAIDWTGGALELAGNFVSGSSIRFGVNASALTSAQLARISAPGFGAFALNSSGYLTASPLPAYSLWAATHAPVGGAADDYDGDGVANALEYVLGGTKDTRDADKLPQVSAAGGNLVFTFQRAQASLDGVTAVSIQVGTTLATWPEVYPVPAQATTAVPGVTVIKNTAPGFDTVTLTVPLGPDPRKFARLQVSP